MSKSNGKKDPAMLFYGTDFYDDEVVKLMSLEQEAVYMRLLWHAWREGSIPDGREELAAIVGVTPQRFAKLWPLIGRKWVTGEADRLVNRRLEHEREVRRERSRKLSEAAAEGNAKRWGGDRNGFATRSPGDGTPAIASRSLPHSLPLSECVSEGAAAPESPEPQIAGGSPPDPPAGSAELREALLDFGVFRLAPRRLEGLVSKLAADRWTVDDLREVAATIRGKSEEQRSARLAALLADDERRTSLGDDMARRKSRGA